MTGRYSGPRIESNLISESHFTLEMLNQAIRYFNYTFGDKTDQPQITGKGFSSRGTIGGNVHGNCCLIRFLHFLIGHHVSEGDLGNYHASPRHY